MLFYSTYCGFCQEIIKLVTKCNMRDAFVFVCVDTNKTRIPSQIDRVPALLIRSNGHLLVEDELTEYILSLGGVENSPQEQLSSAYADQYSFIEETESESHPEASAMPFAQFGNEQKIHIVEENDGKSKRGDSYTSQQYEQYMTARERDIQSIRATQPQPRH